MSRAARWLHGLVLVEAEGERPEAFLNLCARCGAAVKDPERVDGRTLRLWLRSGDLPRLTAAAEGYELRRVKTTGIARLSRRLQRRWVLLGAALLCLAGLYSISSRVWDIRISGNETVATERILTTLSELGLRPGIRAAEVDSYRLRNCALLELDELIWLSVNVRGCRAEVQVRERTPAPAVEEMNAVGDLTADKGGLITGIQVYRGAGCVTVGQTVAEGDLLISGSLTDLLGSGRSVRALGEVWARTWYTLRAQIPLVYTEKQYTGEKTVKNSILFGQQRVNLYFNCGIPYDSCDKIIRNSSGELLDVVALPVVFVQETWLEYIPVQVQLERSAAEAILATELRAQLAGQTDGEVLAERILFQQQGGVLTGTLYAECLEQIGVWSPLSPLPEPVE